MTATERPAAPPAERLPWRQATLAARADETARARTLLLDVPGWPGHRPGQHLDVRLTAEDGYQAQRSYSIASPPEAPRLALTIERLPDGEVSPYLAEELRVGEPVELRGPIGGYFTWTVADGGPLVLVAGGSGIAPLMAMLRHREAAGSRVPATLVYSSRSWEDVIFRDELDRMAAEDPALSVVHALTRAQPAGWTGFRRRIDAAMLADTVGPPEPGAIAFVCGPTALVERAATDLVILGFTPGRVRTERFGPTGA